MMKEYRLIGTEAEISKVIQENRIRVERGLIKFIPCSTVEVDGKKVVLFDSKDVMPEADDKKPKCPKRKKTVE